MKEKVLLKERAELYDRQSVIFVYDTGGRASEGGRLSLFGIGIGNWHF